MLRRGRAQCAAPLDQAHLAPLPPSAVGWIPTCTFTFHATWWSRRVMQVSYHNHHAETVWKAWSLYTNLLFSVSKFYSVFMTSHPGGVTLSMVHGGPEMVVHVESVWGGLHHP
jgi:hypothetical protein